MFKKRVIGGVKIVQEYFQQRKFLVVCAVVFLLLGLFRLDSLSLLHDERDIVFTGYSIAKTGHDLTGKNIPLQFEKINPKSPITAIYYSALWWQIFPTRSVFFARLPFLLATTLGIFILYEFLYSLIKNSNLALLSTAIFYLSPWMIHLSHMALEVNIAVPLVFLAMTFHLRERRVFAAISYILAFFTYQAFRVSVPFYILFIECILLYQHSPSQKKLKSLTYPVAIISVLFVLSLAIDRGITSARLHELIFFNQNIQKTTVELARSNSNAPHIFQTIFVNKLTVVVDYTLDRFIKGLDLSYLFKRGDESPINGNTVAGQFFLPFVIFYILGIATTITSRKVNWLPVGFIFLGMIPTVVNTVGLTYSIRSVISGVGFAYLIAVGINFSTEKGKVLKPLVQKTLLFVCLIVTGMSVLFFLYGYYFQRKLPLAELFFENERQLAVILQQEKGKQVVVYHSRPHEALLSYAFFDNTISISEVKPTFSNNVPSQIKNISIYPCIALKRMATTPGTTIFYDDCVDKMFRQQLLSDPLVKKIPFLDNSMRIAYYVKTEEKK